MGGRPPKAAWAGRAEPWPRARGGDRSGGVVPPSSSSRRLADGRSSWSFGSSSTRPAGASPGRAAGRLRGLAGFLPSRPRGGARGDVVHVRRNHRRILVLILGGFPVVEDRDLRHDSGSDPPGGPIPVVPGDRGRRVRPRRAGEGILWPVLGGGGHAVAANLATRGPRPRHGTSAHWSVRG